MRHHSRERHPAPMHTSDGHTVSLWASFSTVTMLDRPSVRSFELSGRHLTTTWLLSSQGICHSIYVNVTLNKVRQDMRWWGFTLTRSVGFISGWLVIGCCWPLLHI